MKILSLYDGISGGRVALERAGIAVERYVAFENNKWAIEVIAHIMSYIPAAELARRPPLPFRIFNPTTQQLTLF